MYVSVTETYLTSSYEQLFKTISGLTHVSIVENAYINMLIDNFYCDYYLH